MTAWGLPARHPWATLAVATLLLAGAIAGIPRLRAQVDFVDTVPASADVDAYRALLDRLEGVRFVAVHMAAKESYRTDAGFDALVAEQQDLTAFLTGTMPPGTFSHSLSAYEAMRQGNYMLAKVATAGNPPASAYALPSNDVAWRYVRDEVRGEAGADVLAADGSSALLLMFLATKDPAEARSLAGAAAGATTLWSAAKPHPATTAAQASGLLVSSGYVDDRNQEDLRIWGLASGIAVAVALLAVVRRPTNILLATLSLAAATLATFGVLGWLGTPISFLTVFLAPMVTGIGMDYALHILHRQDQLVESGARPRAGLAQAMRDVGPATLAGAATTAAALLVLVLVPAPLFAQVGAIGALGVALGFLTSITLAPALRAAIPMRQPRPRRDRIGPAVGAVGSWSLRHPATVATLLAVLLVGGAVAAWQGTRLESGSAENEFPAHDPVLLLQKRIEKEYGAFQRAYLIVQGPLADADALAALDQAVAKAASLPLFRSASAVTTLLRADAATDQGILDIARGAAGMGDGLPATDADARAALDRLFADPLWRTLAPFVVTRDATLAVVAIQVDPWDSQTQLSELDAALHAQASELRGALGPGYTVHAAGAPVNRAAVLDQTPADVRLATFGVAAVVVATLALAWARRPRGVAVAVAAGGIVLAAALLLVATVPALDAAYRWSGTGNSAALNDMFLLAFAVTVGVGVDGFLQMAHRNWETRDPARAMRETGRAVFGTWLTTVAAFAPLAGAYFLQTKNLAILIVAGSVYAFVLTLLAGPWVMRWANGVHSRRGPQA
ncbi:MAG: uncharacterized protein QOD77_1557 [Thermoplasmata archaeon]|nr:uncharacterized protein [Thermoplasmata archaeon]